jgi:alkanesulfonate monooxygenase
LTRVARCGGFGRWQGFVKLNLIGTCPTLGPPVTSGKDYLARVAAVSRQAEDDGWEAILVYTDHRQADPWLLAQVILQSTTRLRPLVATQPVYMHPFSLARNIATLSYLHGRQVYINMVAGGFPRDLAALGDTTPHDQRYERLLEYVTIVHDLLGKGFSTLAGRFYDTKDLTLPPLPPELRPVVTTSGSSVAGLAVAKQVGARAIQYLRPSYEYAARTYDPREEHGTRLGVIVRDSREEAWAVARRRFPEDADGRALRKLAVAMSDSVWVKELDRQIRTPVGHPYSLDAYKSYKSHSPFIVGSTSEVSAEIACYLRVGFRTFLLEQPTDAEDSRRITDVFRQAAARADASS